MSGIGILGIRMVGVAALCLLCVSMPARAAASEEKVLSESNQPDRIAVIDARLDAITADTAGIRRQLRDVSSRIHEERESAIAENEDLTALMERMKALEEELAALRVDFAGRLRAQPEVGKQTDTRDALMAKLRALSDERRALMSEKAAQGVRYPLKKSEKATVSDVSARTAGETDGTKTTN